MPVRQPFALFSSSSYSSPSSSSAVAAEPRHSNREGDKRAEVSVVYNFVHKTDQFRQQNRISPRVSSLAASLFLPSTHNYPFVSLPSSLPHSLFPPSLICTPSLPPIPPGKPTHIVLVGPCGAGKTSIYHQLLFEAVPETVTSMEESEGVDKQRGFTLVGREGGREGGKVGK